MGMVSPALKRRRGKEGLYAQPRNILGAIPGVKLVEMPRIKENAFCCGAGRGTKEAFPDLSSFSAKQRLEEVREVGAEALISACPWCKNNFSQAVKESGDNIKVMDISELILASVKIQHVIFRMREVTVEACPLTPFPCAFDLEIRK
jgi:Fe-S oxidoreductase